MKTIDQWLNEYGESHQNKINKIIHWICIPLIFWSIISLLSLIPHSYLDVFNILILNELMHFGTLVIFFGLIFYFRLSYKIFLGMLIFSLFIILSIYYILYQIKLANFSDSSILNGLEENTILFYLSMIVFIISWILQFIGHKIEGQKPSFLKDIQFLLIGPAWLIGFLYKKLKINY